MFLDSVRPLRTRSFTTVAALGTVAALWGAGLVAIAAQPAAAATVTAGFDVDRDRNGVTDCWFVNRWGTQSSRANLTAGRTGRAQVLSGSWFASGASLRLAPDSRCMLPAAAGQQVRTAVWYQASGPAQLWLEARPRGGAWQTLTRSTLVRTGTWSRVTATTTMPAGVAEARVQFRLSGPGRLIVDDLTLDRVNQPAPATSTPNVPTNATPTPRPPTPTSTPTAPVATTPPPTTTTPATSKPAAAVLFAPKPPGAQGLVTNEYATYNGGDPAARRSADWSVNSGSLFARDGSFWSGVPDDREPNATSSNGTDSAIFRVNTPRLGAADAVVRMKLRLNRMTSTPSTPQVAWDGVHLFLRYQSETNLYYASVARRDGAVVLKKKCNGGSSNGGTYYTLAERSGMGIPFGTWTDVGATVKNNADGSVSLSLQRNAQTVLTAVDRGVGCSTIRSAGSLGVRGDNTDFQFADFIATAG